MKLQNSKLLVALAALILSYGCAQTMQPTPEPVSSNYRLEGLPYDLVKVKAQDFRLNKEGSEGLALVLQQTIEAALSPRSVPGAKGIYNLKVDIIEHKAYFTFGNWNGITRLRASLLDSTGRTWGRWEARGDAHRSNLAGYDTARAVANDAYRAALADLMSQLSGVRLAK